MNNDDTSFLQGLAGALALIGVFILLSIASGFVAAAWWELFQWGWDVWD
jgi:hypothetical protein